MSLPHAVCPVVLRVFFGCGFGVTKCATAQRVLSRDPEREPPLTAHAGRGERDVTRNRKAEKMGGEQAAHAVTGSAPLAHRLG